MTITQANLEARSKGIGSSDAPVIMGVSPYKQWVDLWLEKTGRKEPDSIDHLLHVRMGNVLEEPLAREWAAQMGVRVRRSSRTYHYPDWPTALSHIDMKVEGEMWVVEVKNRSARQADQYGEPGSADVMASDYVQCQHHCMCGQWAGAYLVVYFGGGDLRHYVIPRDDRYIQKLLEEEKKFWAYVEGDERPPLNYEHATTRSLLEHLYPGAGEGRVELGNHGQSLHEEWRQARDAERIAGQQAAQCKAELLDLMGEHRVGLLPDGTAWRKAETHRKETVIPPKSYVDFRHVKKVPL